MGKVAAYRRERIEKALQRAHGLKMAYEKQLAEEEAKETEINEKYTDQSSALEEYKRMSARVSVQYWKGLVSGMQTAIDQIAEELEL